MNEHNYEEGLRDGRIQALENIQLQHDKRLDTHDHRIRQLERVSYIVLGIVLLIQIAPSIKDFLAR